MTASFRRMIFLVAVLALALPLARAQDMPIMVDTSPKSTIPDASLPQYDVTSVKEHPSGEQMMRIMNKPDGFSCTNIPLKSLVANAYGIRQDLISGGPSWVGSTGFDVEAKVAGADVEAFKKLTPRQRSGLLQALLADRFKLKIHSETKVLPLYDMVIAKGGLKLKASAPVEASAEAVKDPEAARHRGMMTMGPGMFKGEGISIQAVGNQFSYIIHYTVIDKTGLTGTYDVNLKFSPDDAGPPTGDTSAESSPTIFTAVQEQLGLKLNATKGPVETLIIDHAEQPSSN
ncbi:TIGR03435 family protein [Granulicella arctica]|uniref:TIGR03435 family protein n=1 Tax=Granulicella arctica TaxID=940613 RepID=UPI0021DFFF58|nr:TIGR03435 family protein [Granulicella arctica]